MENNYTQICENKSWSLRSILKKRRYKSILGALLLQNKMKKGRYVEQNNQHVQKAI